MKEKKDKIYNDPDFINSKKHKFSLKQWHETSNVSEATRAFIRKALMLTDKEIDDMLAKIAKKVRSVLGD